PNHWIGMFGIRLISPRRKNGTADTPPRAKARAYIGAQPTTGAATRYHPGVIWGPFLLALALGLLVSAGLYFAYMWPQVEPEDPAPEPAPESAPEGPESA